MCTANTDIALERRVQDKQHSQADGWWCFCTTCCCSSPCSHRPVLLPALQPGSRKEQKAAKARTERQEQVELHNPADNILPALRRAGGCDARVGLSERGQQVLGGKENQRERAQKEHMEERGEKKQHEEEAVSDGLPAVFQDRDFSFPKIIFSDCDWWPPISFESSLLVSGMWEKEPRKSVCTPACFPCKQLLLVCGIFTNKLQTAT